MIFLFFILHVIFAQEECGCGKSIPTDVTKGELSTRMITIHDFKTVDREYSIVLPQSYDPHVRTPMLIYYHGWGSDYIYEANELDYEDIGLLVGVITVYVRGMSDYTGSPHKQKGDPESEYYYYENPEWGWSSFNTGIAGDESVCTADAEEYEYESCKELHKEGRCNWQTCYDDILMTEELVKLLKREFCVDESQLLATGESNGGMFTYQIMQRLPHLFAGFMPIFGLPAVGHGENFDCALKHKTIFHYHGRYDKTVPVAGGASEDGWLYDSLDDTISKIAKIQECGDLETLPTPIKMENPKTVKVGAPMEENIECWEYKDCTGKVGFCLYDGTHTKPWPLDHMAELTFWFFDFHRNDETSKHTSRLLRNATREMM